MTTLRLMSLTSMALVSALGASVSYAQPITASSNNSNTAAVTARATNSAIGVSSTSDSGWGVLGISSTYGVGGLSSGHTSTGANNSGVFGQCQDCFGVLGASTNADGVNGQSQSGNGVYGSGGFNGVLGVTSSTNPLAGGVHGVTNGSGNAMRAESNGDGNGLVSTANAGYAIWASSATTDAIVGVAGNSLHAAGVWGKSNGASTYGLYSSGDLYVTALGASPGNAYKPGGGSWLATSDARVKKDVAAFTPSLSELERVHAVRFKYNGLGGTVDSGKEYVGVIAQDLEKVLPFMVSSHKGKLRDGDKEATDIKEVDPSAFTYALINAVKELSAKDKAQEAAHADLVRRLDALSQQNQQLAAQVKQLSDVAHLACKEHPSEGICDGRMAAAHETTASVHHP